MAKNAAPFPDPNVVHPSKWSDEEKVAWISANERIIGKALSSYRGMFEEEDLRQMANEAILKVYNGYEPNRGVKLSTYAYRAIRNEVNMYIRAATAKKRSASVVPYNQTENEDGTTMGGAENLDTSDVDWLHVPQLSVESEIERREACAFIRKIVAKKLTQQEQDIFELMVAGATQVMIGAEIGCSQAKISNAQKVIRAKILYELRAAGFDLTG